jgi:hypothetical protein
MHSMPSKGLPPDLPRTTAQQRRTRAAVSAAPAVPPERHACTAFDAGDYAPMTTSPTAAKVIDALLKKPGSITYEITKGRRAVVGALLFGVLTICMLSYGIVMGFFSGAQQLWVVPAKTVLGFLLSGLLCLPSLYILASLAGARQSLGEMAALLLSAMALCAMLLLGFAPITWVFSQSTEATQFMGALHIVFLGVALWFSLQLLRATLEFLNKRAMATVATWCVIFAVVLLQMGTTLRPLVGPFEDYELGEKKLFLVHWLNCLSDD